MSRSRKHEWFPFVVDANVTEVAQSFVKGNERFNTLAIKMGNQKYFTFFFTPKTVLSGFLILDASYNAVKNQETCYALVKTFHVWKETYYKPPMKHQIGWSLIAGKKIALYSKLYEDYRARIASGNYTPTGDPTERNLQVALEKLDVNFVSSYELLVSRVNLITALSESEKDLWTDLSFEKVNSYVNNVLPRLKESNTCLMEYLRERTEIMFELEKTLNDYLSNLKIVKYRGLAMIIAAFLASNFNIFYGLMIQLTQEIAKVFYKEPTKYCFHNLGKSKMCSHGLKK